MHTDSDIVTITVNMIFRFNFLNLHSLLGELPERGIWTTCIGGRSGYGEEGQWDGGRSDGSRGHPGSLEEACVKAPAESPRSLCFRMAASMHLEGALSSETLRSELSQRSI